MAFKKHHQNLVAVALVVVMMGLLQVTNANTLQPTASASASASSTSFLAVSEALSLGSSLSSYDDEFSEESSSTSTSDSYSTDASEDSDPHCDVNTPTCCFGLKCAFPNAICCSGSSSCCPQGSVCLPLTLGETQKCGHNLPQSNIKHIFTRPHRRRHTRRKHCPCARSEEEREECACLRRRMLGCPCASDDQVDPNGCPCSNVPEEPECGQESSCRPKVQPEIVNKDDLESDGLQRPLIKGRDIDVPIRVLPPPPPPPQPPANATNSTPTANATTPAKPHVKTLDEIELEKLKQEEKDSEQDLKDLRRKLIQARKENDTVVLSDVNLLRDDIRKAETRMANLHNNTIQKEKKDEEREKVTQILKDRKLKADKLEEENTKRKEKIRNELEYKSQMKRLLEEQDKADATAAEQRAKNLAEAERLHKNILEADNKATEKFSGDTAAETSRAKAAAAEAAASEASLKAEVQKMKAVAAAAKAKLDQAVANFTQTVQTRQQEKVEQMVKSDQEQTQKQQELEIANAIRKYRDSPS